jgi:hypothetical protein
VRHRKPPKAVAPEPEAPKRKPGRPKVDWMAGLSTEQIILRLAEIQCTHAEIAAVLGCSTDTVANNYSELIKKGSECGKSSLRRWQWISAENGNPTMQIWLGKQMLGQTDKMDLSRLTDDELIALTKSHIAGSRPKGSAPARSGDEPDLGSDTGAAN